ncbi:MAG: hypothetical protein U9N54_10485 [candidate division Zixibacteria bacterium]|nr:hypothetical protein [candidate division Zixibacteria bacterium]
MKKLILILFFIVSSILSYSQINVELNNNNYPDFIIITHTGDSDYSISSIIISTDTIKSIDFPEGYESYRKFSSFVNVILSDSTYNMLFNYLNVFINSNKRKDGFTKKYYLIFDYRDSNGADYELLSLGNIPSILFTLRNLHEYLVSNKFEKPLIIAIEYLYKYYVDMFNNKLYQRDID